MKSQLKKILITGGAGFIGSNFINYLLNKYDDYFVINLDALTYAGNLENLNSATTHKNYLFIKGDVCDKDLIEGLLENHSPHCIVHFAAESHVDRSIESAESFIQTNIFGTFTLLEATRKYYLKQEEFRFLHVSTDEVYGSLGGEGYFTEETAYAPNSPYSASKAGSDHLVRSYYHTYGLPVLTTHSSNNYGPYQFPEKLIPLILCRALAGENLPVYGDGNNVRDWIYVVDHCKAILSVLEHGTPGEIYNIGGNAERENIVVVETICDILDNKVGFLNGGKKRKELIRFVKDRPGHDRRYAIDSKKIHNELNWQPEVSFSQGIDLTISWYINNKEWVQNVMDGSYRRYCEIKYKSR